jgi:hypothetical protein
MTAAIVPQFDDDFGILAARFGALQMLMPWAP